MVLNSACSFGMKVPPPLESPLNLTGKDESAKNVNWEDDGVLTTMDMDLF